MGLKRNLEIIWAETTGPMAVETSGRTAIPHRRYIARAFSGGGSGWGVYDIKENRFLKDREVSRLSVDDIRMPAVLQ